jgi:YesN/AraC family two-component response regulator
MRPPVSLLILSHGSIFLHIAGLYAMLTGQCGLELVGEAANGREALMLCRRLQPDLALIDVRIPEQDGLATYRAI